MGPVRKELLWETLPTVAATFGPHSTRAVEQEIAAGVVPGWERADFIKADYLNPAQAALVRVIRMDLDHTLLFIGWLRMQTRNIIEVPL